MYGWGPPPMWYGPPGGGMPPQSSAEAAVLRMKMKALKKLMKEQKEKQEKEKKEREKPFEMPKVRIGTAILMAIFWGPIVGFTYLAFLRFLLDLVQK